MIFLCARRSTLHIDAATMTPRNLERFGAMPRLLSLRLVPSPALTLGDTRHKRPHATGWKRFTQRNPMLNADHRFSGFAMRKKEY